MKYLLLLFLVSACSTIPNCDDTEGRIPCHSDSHYDNGVWGHDH